MIGNTNIGLTYKPENISNDGTIVLRSSNILNGKIDYTDIVRVNSLIKDNQYAEENDILICARNGSKSLVGKCAIIPQTDNKMSFGAFMAIYRTPFYRYVYYFLNSKEFKKVFDDSNSTAINQLTQVMLKRTILPLPPMQEQIKICNIIHELFDNIENIEDSLN
ncbi:MAG: restriction endonuclease subunit S [Lactobacillus sp.]|nr:restriction endonuclease subunit S [Lactobacillus sp.]